MRSRLLLPLVALLTLASTAPAQSVKPGDDPLARLLFDPMLVLKFSTELGIQPAQRAAILDAIKAAQGEILDRQLQMVERQQDLVKLMESQRIDEAAALTQAERLMGLEREVKRSQLQLLIRIKNTLNERQQNQLQELRKVAAKIGSLETEARLDELKKSVVP